ncbi:inverse autotransporter adhesin Ilp [Yersinia pseudotuberculosis]|uniref:inverse autotransporter adhesin Ilp n=18 Tax=Yersinia pseudotuberculosis TaxID=633 RepID=UPI0004F65C05|nr:inverse autotransporter adhesin Ilp [Yersinia pseudotuberculosis]AIN12742.1 bacterial Ig-like domain family protein [Yersinia pseudotuberculosis]
MLNYFRAILISWKWKLSHHTSRPHDVKEKGHPRKIKVVAWITLFFQFAFPLSLSFTPAIAAANTTNSAPTSVITPVNASILPPAARATEPYTLGPGDSIQSIAKKYNITVDELKKLNAYRTFSKPFASLTTGDEIEVPRKESSFFSNNPNENNKKDVDDLLARNAMGAGKLLSNDNTSDAASNMARSAVTNEINASSQQWLNQFGTARVQLNVDSDFKLDNSALDLLVPLKDSESSLLFTQLGVRNKDSRNTVNIGAGIRQYQGDWMYGANTFFDNDLTGKNRRVGVGAEVATDYLKFSANTYFGLTGWHQSRDFSSYDERPADGFDIRTEAYLPAYPQLGGKLMYEKYRGDEVALFGKDDRQKDPHAVTLGVNYTPVPLVTIGAEHREGKGNNNNTSVNVQLNYRMGQPWNDQIDQSAVAANRTLAGSRYDLVERNNNIVLDYKKQELIHLVLPDRISGSGGGAITLTAQVRAKYGFSRIEWDATPLENAGGSTSPLTQSSLSVTLPFYQHILRTSNTHTISAVAYDAQGNASNRAVTSIEVTRPETMVISHLATTVDNATANGIAANTVQATVTDGDGQPIIGQIINFAVNTQATLSTTEARTGANGIASTTLTHTVAGVSAVSATLGSSSRSVNTTFVADESTAEITAANLTVTTNDSVANGSDTNAVRAKVTDAYTNAVANQSVIFSASNGATVIDQTVITNAEGIADSTLTNTTAGVSAVTATLGSQSQQVDTTFKPGSTAAISLMKLADRAVADGIDQNEIQVVLRDGTGNAVPNVPMSIQADNGAIVVASTPNTGVDGTINATFTNLRAGESVVSVTSPALVGMTMTMTFSADQRTAVVSTLAAIDNNAKADGTDTNVVRAWVVDANGNSVPGVSVTFDAGNGAVLAQNPVVTDRNGYAENTLTNLAIGTTTVKATTVTDPVGQTVNTHFVAGAVDTITLTVPVNGAVANGVNTNSVQAVVSDSGGNPVTGATVVFSSTNATAQVTTVIGTTGVDGIATATLTNTVAGTSNVVATIGSITNNIDTTFVPGAVATITLTTPVNGAVANGADSNSVQAVVSDSEGNAVAGAAVVFSSANATAQITTVIGTTGADGIATATLTNTVAGTSNVVATIDTVNANIDTTFVAGAVATITLSVPVNDATADGADTNQVDALVQDANGNAITGAAVVFSSANGADIIAPTMNTGVNGVASTLLTHTVAGTSNVVATIDTVNANIDTTFVAGAVATITLSVPVNDATADGADTNQVDALVQDANGNAITGAAVVFSSANGATILSSTVNTGADGIASTTLTHTQSGVSNVVATIDTVNANIDTTFVAGAVATITLSVPVNDATADGADTNQVDALVQDANGNAITGAAVVFSSSNATAQITTVIGTTGADGIATATLTNTVAGTSNVVATIGSITNNIDTAFVAGAVAAITLTTPVNGAVADGANSNSVQAVVSDSEGNPVTGAAVVFSSANATAQITTVIGTTGADGIATATLTNTVAGTSNVVATIGGITNNIDTTFVAGAVAAITLTTPVDGAVADGTDSNSVQAVVSDSGGNPVTGATVVFSSANATAQITTVIGTTGADGIATATLTNTVAGTSNVVATIGSITNNIDTAFVPGAVATITLTTPVNGAVADGANSNSVQAVVSDSEGNAVAGAAVVFSSANATAQITTVIGTTGADGIATATLTNTVAGTSNVVATIGSITNNIDTAFVPGAVATITLTTPVNGAVADGANSNSVQAVVSDSEGNAVAGAAVVFSSANATAQITTVIGTTGADGIATATLTNTVAGTSNVVATIGGITNNIDTAFVAGAVATITLTTPVNGAVADGANSNSVQAVVSDSEGNPVNGATVVFSSINATAQITTVIGTTGADGIATATLTNTVAGTSNVAATIGSITDNIDTVFVAGAVATITLSVPVNDATADGADTNQVDALVQDANGNAITGAAVVFSSANGATILSSTMNTGVNGVASTLLTHTVAGTSNVVATIDTVNANIDTAFVAGAVATITLTTPVNGAVANGADSNSVQAVVSDSEGNAVAGAAVVFSSANATAQITTVIGTTGADGIATATLTNTVAGTSNVVATIGSITENIDTTFVAGAVATITLSVPVNDATADGADTNQVDALVQDANGNAITGAAVVFSSANGADIIAPTMNTGVNGVASTLLTHTQSGVSNVVATIDTVNANIDTTFVPGAVATITLSVPVNDATADGADTNQVDALVQDASGNAITGAAVVFSSANGATILSSTVNTGADGIASTTLTHTQSGVSNVVATIDTVNANIDTTFVPGAVATITLSVPVNDATADGADTNQVDALVQDANGNAITGAAVVFSSANGADIIAPTMNTGVNGVASTLLTHTQSGVSNVVATIDTVNANIDTTFVPGAVATITLSVPVNDATADGADTNQVDALVQDASGNAITGAAVVFSSANGATILSSTVNTGADGIASTTLTHTQSGVSNVVATIDTVNANIDTTFVPGAVATITLSVPVNDATADGADTNQVDALVQDANGNAITGAAVVFSSANGATILSSTVNTGADGIASTTLTHTQSGVSNVVATVDTVNANIDTAFVAGAVATITLSVPVNDATADGADTNQVGALVQDANGNAITGAAVVFSSANGATILSSTVNTGADGIASTTLTHTQSGVSNVVATVDTVNANIDTTFVAGAVATITLSVPVNDATADGADTNQVDALVQDANGNAITGAAVVFSSANGADIIAPTMNTGVNGVASTLLTHTQSGVSNVVATIDTVNANIDTTFVPGAVATITLSVPVNDATADGADTNQVDALVQDASGNAITGAAVVFSSANGATILSSTVNTGADGIASTTLTHTQSGVSNVVATIDTVNANIDTTFVPGAVATITLSVPVNDATADGADTNQVDALVQDANGNAITGAAVVFSSANATTQILSSTVTTGADGIATATLTNTQSGVSNVVATVDTVNANIDTTFVAGAVATITLSVLVNDATADGADTNQVDALVQDANGNAITGAAVVFSSANGATILSSTVNTGADGIASTTLTHTQSGVSNVVATVDTVNANIDTAFVAGAVATITLSVLVNDATADGADTNQVDALVQDANGNAITGAAVVFSSANGATILSSTMNTGVNGVASTLLTHTQSGVSNVVATIDTVNANIDTTFVAGAVAAITLTTPVDGAVADGTDSNSVQAVVSDSEGNAVAGAAVVFSSANATAQITTVIGTTGADGIATATLTNTVAGTSNVVATIDTISANIDTTFVAGAVAAITLTTPVDGAVADGTDSNSVQAVVSDSDGNPVTGATVVFSSTNATAQITTVIGTTGVDGIATATLTNTVAGTSNVVATVDTVNANIDTTFVAGAVATITLTTPVNGAVADGADTNQVDALVQDANGNAITGAAVVFSSTNGADIIVPTMNTGVNGVASTLLTHTMAGTSNVIATIDTVNANIDTTFVAGAVATITLSVPVNDATADGADTNQVDALVQDANGNAITGAAVVFSSANGATILSSTMNTGVNGVASTLLTHTQSGVSNVVATIDTVNANIDTTFVAGAVAAITLTTPVDGAVADGTDSNSVQAVVSDSEGNAVAGAAVVFSSANATAQITTVIGTTGADGIATATLTNTVAGTSNVVATVDTVNANIDTTFVAGAVATITLTTPVDGAVANGADSNSVQAVVSDSEGNAVAGAAVVFSSANATAQITTVIGTTGADGIATATLTNTVAGTSNVVATIGSITNNIDTTFVPGAVATITLTTPVNGAVADGANSNSVQAVVSDSEGNAVAGAAVVFSSANATAQITTVIGTTGADGIATATLTNTVAGTSNVAATIGSITDNIDTVFVAGAVATITLTTPVDGAVANGADSNSVQAVVTDSEGNAVAGAAVVFSSANATAQIITVIGTTGADGIATATLTNTMAGTSNVVATIGSITNNIDTAFVAGAVATITLTTPVNDAVADGTDSNSVQAVVTDSGGNPVTGATVVFSSTNTTAQVTTMIGTTGADGIATATLTNTMAGTSNVVATIGSITNNIDTAFVAGAVATITLTTLVNGAVANGADSNSVQAVVSDSGGNPVTGATVVFSSANATAQITTVIGTTGADGIATATLTNTVAGTSNVVATIGSITENIDTTFVAGAVATITLSVPVNDATADGADTNQVDALVQDANGNAITGAAVVFSSANGADIIAPTMNTGVNGVASTLLTHTVAGTSNVIATIDTVNANIDTTFVAGAVATITLTTLVNGAVADGANSNSVQAVVTDSQGNPVTGATVVFSSTNATAQITTVIGTTGADGIATATLTNTVAGTSNVVATIGSITNNIDTTFVAGELENIVVSIINNNALANGADTNIVEAFVTDRFGNGVANQSLMFGTNGASIVGSSTVTTNIDGRVRVSATHTVAGSSNTVFAISGAHQGYTRVTFVADASTAQLKLTSFLDNQLANGKAGNIAQALVTDAYDNPLANQSVSFALDNGAVIESRGDASSASGIVLMRFNNTLAGMTTVTATLDSTGQTETLEMHFVAGKAASIELTMTKDNAVANNIDTNEVQVLVTDADGNAINGAVVNLTSNSGMNITPNSVTTGSDGTATATLTHTLAGSLPINARIDQVSKTINATFIADVSTAQIIASDMFIIVNDQVANGQAVNVVQARVTDSYGNPIQGQLVEFVLSNTGTIQYKLDETSVEGGVMVTFTNTRAGITNVTATVVSSRSSQNVDTTFIADVTTAHIAESDLMVIVDNAVANNSEKNEVHARVTDAKGNVLSGQTVIFTSGNGAAITTVNGISDGDGLTKATLTHTLAGTSVVTARVGNQVQSKDTTFIADRTTATIRASDLTITRSNALADGVDTNAARVIVTDAYGNPVPSMLVSYTSENGATLTPTLGSTDSSGMLSTTFTHTIAGISKVTATIVTMGISQAKDAVFIADRTTAHVSALTVEKNDSLANNSDRNIVQAHIQDAHGNVITGMNVNFSATENVTLAANMVTTNAQGYAENTLRHNAPVTSAVTATVATDLVGLTEDVRFVAGAGARIELFRLNDGAVADGIQTNRVEARVYDVSDNLVPNSNVVFSADNGGQLVQNDVQTDALGSAYVTVSNINTGVTKVSVTADGVSASTTTTFIADKDTVTLRADLFLITHDNAVANGVTENRVLLQLLDANDNKVSGVEVNFTATNGASINASAITDTNGLAIGVLTNTLSGPSDVTVTLVTPGGTESLTVTPQFIADINTARIANGDFVIIDDGAVANSVDANEVRARVTDNQGNAIAGYSVTFASQNGATITTSGITGVDGWASAKLTHTKAGESGILARISRPGSMVQVLTPYFIADVSTATLQLFNFNPIPIIADGVMQFFVLGRVFDANQNPVGGQQVAFSATNEVTLTESNGSISTPEGSVLLSVTSTQAGVHPITGTLVSNNYTDTFGATFIANKNTAQLSTLMVVDNNALADGVTRNQVRAHVVDSTGNSVADIAVTFTANHGAQLSHVTVLTDDNGDAVNTLTNSLVGVTVVTAKLGTAGTPLTVDTVFTAGPLATLTLVTMVDNAFADNSATNTVQATLKDATGNPIVGEVVAFAASNGATITATDGGVSNANGIVLATLTNGAAGVSTVTATIETLTATTETTFIAMKNLDVTVGDTTFDGDAGFPTTGFVGAAFKVNSGGDNSLYDWSSSAPALVSVSGEGVVTFNAVFPTGTPAITISATPKGGGSPLSYSFRVNQWFINNNGVALNRADAATYCANAGYTTVSSSQVTNAIVWGMGTRAMGNLWSEWGDFNNYNVPGWEPAEFFWLSDNYNATDGLAASLSHGMLTTMGDPMAMIHVMCTRPI